MKVTNKQIIASVPSLNIINKLSLPVKTAFKLAKVTRTLEGVLEVYNNTLAGIQQAHAVKDLEGNATTTEHPNNPNVRQYVFKDRAAFDKDYQDLLNLETEIEFEPMDVEELGSIEATPSTLYDIAWLIAD